MPSIFTREELLAAETGTVRKNPGGKLRVALVYPNTYAVAMSNLGFQALYGLFNTRADVSCERAFLPEGPAPTQLRTLESGTPLSEMDVVAFSISFELDLPHIPGLLRLCGVEPFAAARNGPLVIAGGAVVSYNPEPIAPFLDAAVIGEAEESVDALVDALWAALRGGSLAPLAGLPGVYLPSAGRHPVERLVVRDLNRTPIETQIYTDHTEFGSMALIEISRGCPYGCKFCVASHVYRPARWRTLEALLPSVERGLRHRARIGLIGASVTDHPQILSLIEEILRRGGRPSPASMRAGALTDELLALLVQGEIRSITLAPEAAREELRRTTGKRLADDALFSAAARAKQADIHHLKLYFIIGLPGETDDDVAAIPALALQLAKASGLRVSLGCSTFVPKPGTPFAREAMISERESKRRLSIIRKSLHGALDFTSESPRWSYWQGVLARGGREMAAPLAAIAAGAPWNEAFRAAGLDPDRYATREIPDEEPVSWAHIGMETK